MNLYTAFVENLKSENVSFHITIRRVLLTGNRVAWMAMLLSFTSCEQTIEPTRQFITYKGDHYSWPKPSESLQSQALTFEARFNESAIYNFGDPALQSNKNKLMGFCDCNSLPHENSARFAWQWFEDRLEIFAYCYNNGVREEKYVGVVNLNVYNHFEIGITSRQYLFRLNNQPTVIMRRGTVCDQGAYFKLWPYFGGHVPAPHNVIIDIGMTY